MVLPAIVHHSSRHRSAASPNSPIVKPPIGAARRDDSHLSATASETGCPGHRPQRPTTTASEFVPAPDTPNLVAEILPPAIASERWAVARYRPQPHTGR